MQNTFFKFSDSISTVAFAQITRKGLQLHHLWMNRFKTYLSGLHSLSKWCLIFPFTGARVYVKLDLARLIHVPCAGLRYPEDWTRVIGIS